MAAKKGSKATKASKAKSSKATGPPDPLAHLSPRSREKLLVQARKLLPPATRQALAAKGAAEPPAVPAKRQRTVGFVDDVDGSGYEIDTDGEGSGIGGIGEEGDEDGGEEEGELDEDMEGHAGTGRGHSKRGGRARGARGYTDAEDWILVHAMQEHLPRSELGWIKVGDTFNSQVPEDCARTPKVLKAKHQRESKKKKPTGDGKGSKLHDAHVELENMLQAQEVTISLDDTWSESNQSKMEETLSGDDNPPPATPAKARARPKPRPPPSSTRAPAPPPFARSNVGTPKGKQPAIETSDHDSDVIVISDSEPIEPKAEPQTEPKVKTEPGMIYRASKTAPAPVKGEPVKRRRTAQKTAENLMNILQEDKNSHAGNEFTGLAKVELFNRNLTIENLHKELAAAVKNSQTLQTRIDNIVGFMAHQNILVPKVLLSDSGSIALALAEGMNTRANTSAARPNPIPPAAINAPNLHSLVATILGDNPVAVVTPTTPTIPVAPTVPIAPAAALDATACDGQTDDGPTPLLLDPALIEGDHSPADHLPVTLPVASGSNLSAESKAKIPVYLGTI